MKSSKGQVALLSVTAGLVVLVAVPLGADHGAAWALLPIGVWLAAVYLVRHLGRSSEADETARHHELKRRQLERKRASVARKNAAQAARREEFGDVGVDLLDRAIAAAEQIKVTEAARTGWLGDPGALDFAADLEAIAADSRTARELQRLIAEIEAMPNPSAEDRALVDDAWDKAQTLIARSREHTAVLETCAQRAELIDGSLRAERRAARLDERHDDLRDRMTDLLHGADATSALVSSESTDRILALVEAYQEIKGSIGPGRPPGVQ